MAFCQTQADAGGVSVRERAARTISGGTRSAAGTRTFRVLATLFGTWRARNPIRW